MFTDAAYCPIGVFDSGYGGLSVLKELVEILPQYDYLYLGDNARTPYGTRSFETVYRYTGEAVRKLFELGCRMVILACNTASAKALRTIQQVDLPKINPDFRVLGVIRPSVESLLNLSRNGHIGILATKGTVVSNSYPIEIEKLHGESGASFYISQLACPLLVPLVENGELDSDGTRYFVRKYVEEILSKDDDMDAVLLACTHYPLLKDIFREFLPSHIRLVEQGAIVADSLADYLSRHSDMREALSKCRRRDFLTTDDVYDFNVKAKIFLGHEILSEHIVL